MSESNTREVVKEVIKEVMGLSDADMEDYNDSSTLKGDIGMDSLDILETAMKIEKELNIEIPDPAIERIDAFGELVEVTEKYLGQQKPKV
jgi:acyl carrier protein